MKTFKRQISEPNDLFQGGMGRNASDRLILFQPRDKQAIGILRENPSLTFNQREKNKGQHGNDRVFEAQKRQERGKGPKDISLTTIIHISRGSKMLHNRGPG